MEHSARRPSFPVSHGRRSSMPRLSIIIKDSRFPDTKTIISPCSPCSPRTPKNKNIATVVVMSPRMFSPVGTPTKILSPAQSRRGSEESSTGRRGSRTSITMAGRRRESIIYRNEQEYDSATAIVEKKTTSSDSIDEEPSTRTSVAPLVTKVRAYSISTKNTRRRAARSGQEQAPIIVAGPRKRSSIVVVHNCAPTPSKEFSEMPEESEDEA